MPSPRSRSLVVSLHDVSPRTRTVCAQALEELTALGVRRTSLLVIPDHHRQGHIRHDLGLCVWLTKLARAGHEIVVHGYHHQRPRRPTDRLVEKATTQVYTADEGEFYDLDREQARKLFRQARDEFRNAGFLASGFIAPAWLLSREAEAALREEGCEYTTRLGTVLDLQRRRKYRSQSLVWSVRSRWRRGTSRFWNAFLFQRNARETLLRIAVHPADLDHPAIWKQIRTLISKALTDRESLTYSDWIRRQR